MMSTLVAKKLLGQNFLTDASIAQLMVESLNVQKGHEILEIGAGRGEITKYLAQICQVQNAYLTAVEFDIDLIPILKSNITENQNIKIVNANILNFLHNVRNPSGSGIAENNHLKVIGSLPYNITSPLLHRLIKNDPMPETCVFLIQKEVAQKICSQAPDSNYLSVFVQTFYKTEILKIIDKKLFEPTPQVDGAVIKFTKEPIDLLSHDISRYEKFLHHAFSQPRKMLNKVYTKNELERYQLDGTNRAQNYNPGDYLKAFTKM